MISRNSLTTKWPHPKTTPEAEKTHMMVGGKSDGTRKRSGKAGRNGYSGPSCGIWRSLKQMNEIIIVSHRVLVVKIGR